MTSSWAAIDLGAKAMGDRAPRRAGVAASPVDDIVQGQEFESAFVPRVLQRLRAALRTFALIEGLALLAGFAIVLFWLIFAFDYFLEPNGSIRQWVAVLTLAALVALLTRYVFSRLWARLSDRSLALLIERRHPELADRLMTAVELRDQPHPFSRSLVRRAATQAADALRGVRVARLIDHERIAKLWLFALTLTMTVYVLVRTQPVIASVWMRRAIYLSDEKYPRATRLRVEGFTDGARKVGRGRDFELHVATDGVVPEKVMVRQWLEKSGASSQAYLTQVGKNGFRHVFRNVLEPIEFRVVGGDDRTETLRLDPVEAPAIREVTIGVEYLPYTGLPPQQLAFVGGELRFPPGSWLETKIASNKPLAWIRATAGEDDLPLKVEKGRLATAKFQLAKDMPIRITFEDRDGVGSERPYELDIRVQPDEPPVIEQVELAGVGSAITGAAQIPLNVRIHDEFGVDRWAFEYAIDGGAARLLPAPMEEQAPRQFEGVLTFDAQPYNWKPGSKLSLTFIAWDKEKIPGSRFFTLPPKCAAPLLIEAVEAVSLAGAQGAYESRSQVFAFEVVTPEELLARLATRELNFRQAFEGVIKELQDTRKSLDGVPETGDDPKAASRRELLVKQAIHALRKTGNETAETAEGFRNILAELQNNRINNTEMLDRLGEGVVAPLDAMVATDFPAVEAALDELLAQLNGDQWQPSLKATTQSLDQLIAHGEAVLNAMLKLESFNELVAMLRDVMENQQRLIQKTKEERKKRILDLLQ